MSIKEKIRFKGDKGILIISIALSLISLTAVLSTASLPVFLHHLLFIGLCFVTMFGMYVLNYKTLSRFATIGLLFAFFLLIVTLFFGNKIRRGIVIGNQEFQTFYFIGFFVIFYIAKFLAKRFKTDMEMTHREEIFLFAIVLAFTGGMAISNMSTAIIFFATSLVVMFVGNVRIKHLLLFFAVACFFGACYLFGTDSGRSSTFRHRCHYYFTHDNSEGYGDQMIKSTAVIARNGFGAAGPGQGIINKNLPEKDTDYVFTSIYEEFGFFAGIFIIFCYLMFFYRSTLIAKNSPGPFGRLLAIGIGFWFCCQGLVHIGVNCGLLPATGQTLPFISRGGSSLLFAGMATGILLNISKDEKGEN